MKAVSVTPACKAFCKPYEITGVDTLTSTLLYIIKERMKLA